MWGVYWMPLLYLEGLGLIGAAAGTALYMGCLVALIPVMIKYRQLFISQWRVLLLSGVLTGCAFFSLHDLSCLYRCYSFDFAVLFDPCLGHTYWDIYVEREADYDAPGGHHMCVSWAICYF